MVRCIHIIYVVYISLLKKNMKKYSPWDLGPCFIFVFFMVPYAEKELKVYVLIGVQGNFFLF